MSEMEQRLEDLFAVDARARRVGRVTVRRRSRSLLPFVLAAAGLVAIVVALALAGARDDRTGVAEPGAPVTSPTATPTPTPCVDEDPDYDAVAGSKAGRYMAVFIDKAGTEGGAVHWYVRWFIGPGADGDPGNATIPLDAVVTGPNGDVHIRSYASGPPDGPFTAATGPVTVAPCRAVVIRFATAQVGGGEFHVLFRGVTLPEGGEPVDVPISPVRMYCGDTDCTADRPGTGEVRPVPTSSPGAVAPPSEGKAVISGEVSYPSDFLPDMDIYAIDVNDPSRWFHVFYEGTEGPPPATQPPPRPPYRLEVEPGTYWVIAYAGERGNAAGLYSRAVTCGLLASCTDHTLIEVTVREGDLLTGIDPGDWYYPPEHEYPDRPR